jgi:hypothetical protein
MLLKKRRNSAAGGDKRTHHLVRPNFWPLFAERDHITTDFQKFEGGK